MRLLVRAPNWLGDAVMALPAVDALGRLGDLLVHATAPTAGILRAAGCAVEEIPHGFSLQAIGSTRRARADAAVLLPNSFSSAAVAALGRAPRRIGYPLHARRLLLTDPVPLPDPRPHQIDEYLRLAEATERVLLRLAVGAGLERSDAVSTAPRLRPDPEEVERWRTRIGAPGGAVGLAPGAAYGPAKRWPTARYVETARRIAHGGRRVVLLGAPADRGTAGEVAAAVPGALDLSGRTRPDDLPPLLAALAAIVTNDSGAAHVAAAVGTPVVTVFGPTDAERTAPRGPRTRVVSAFVECAPCQLRRCPIDHRCMTRIGTPEVLSALAEVLEDAP